MVRYVNGDERAFNVLMSRYQGRVWGYIYRHCYNRDRAAELFQDSFYKLVRAAASFDPNRRFSTWLFTIVRNTLIDSYKKRRLKTLSMSMPLEPGDTKRTFGDTLSDPESADGEKTSRQKQLEGRLQQALEKLNPDQREVFVLRQFEGLPFADIAELQGCPENTAKTRMRYALESLRRELEDFA